MKYSELAINKNVYTALKKYTTQDDYLELFNQVESAFSKLIKENNEIYQLTKRTIPGTRQIWEDTVYYAENTEGIGGTEDTEMTETTESSEISTEVPSETPSETPTEVPSQTPETQPEQQPESEPEVQKVKVTAGVGVRVRSGAGTDFTKLGDVYDGDVFVKLGVETGSDGHEWVKIQYNDSVVGYIRSDFVSDVTE
jgi:hypothetical protein